jgi:hypothetical protein
MLLGVRQEQPLATSTSSPNCDAVWSPAKPSPPRAGPPQPRHAHVPAAAKLQSPRPCPPRNSASAPTCCIAPAPCTHTAPFCQTPPACCCKAAQPFMTESSQAHPRTLTPQPSLTPSASCSQLHAALHHTPCLPLTAVSLSSMRQAYKPQDYDPPPSSHAPCALPAAQLHTTPSLHTCLLLQSCTDH